MSSATNNEAEKALGESEQKYSNLFHFTNDAIFIHDLNGTILDANQKAATLFNYPVENLLSLNIQDLHPPKASADVARAFDSIVRDGVIKFQIDFKKKDGSVFPAEVSASLLEIGGKKVVQGIVRDVSQQIETEAALQR